MVFTLKSTGFDGQGDTFQPFTQSKLITPKDVTPFQRMQIQRPSKQKLILS